MLLVCNWAELDYAEFVVQLIETNMTIDKCD